MFRHKTSEEPVVAGTAVDLSAESDKIVKKEVPAIELPGLRELIEKNLKWSQIIYEQNRKINNKLLWASVFGWFKIILVVAPLIFAFIYLQPLLGGVLKQYGSLLGLDQQTETKPASVNSLLQMFNLDPAKQEQLKALLK